MQCGNRRIAITGFLPVLFVFALFLIPLFAQAETTPTPLAAIIFSDDFNDNTIDPAKWTTSGSSVVEQDGMMKVSTDVTDDEGKLDSSWIEVNSTQPITVSRRVMIHAANDLFSSFFRLRFDSNNDGEPNN